MPHQTNSVEEVVEEIMSCQHDLEPEERIDKDWLRSKLTTLVSEAKREGREENAADAYIAGYEAGKALSARTISSDKK